MAGPFAAKTRPLVVGANHRSSSLMLRDRLFVEDASVPAFLEHLRRSGVTQAIVLSTCDRVEVQAIHEAGDAVPENITRIMAEHAQLSPDDLGGQIYVLRGDEAVRHIFMVAASLDSLMIGEPQVLGQVKAAHRMARDAGMTGSELEAVLQAAYASAKRVRSETAIDERPVSIAAAAARLAQDLHGDLSRCTGLLMAGGDMGELVAKGLISAGLGHLMVTHPKESRAESAARNLDCHVVPFDTLAASLAEADIVLTSMGTRRYTVTADMVSSALRKRRHAPIFLVDTAIPGDIEPSVNRIEEAFLYDLNDLERVAMEGRAIREGEAVAARGIINAEVADFLRGRAERTAVPAVVRLRQHFETMRDGVLADAGDDAQKATRLLVNRLLHAPSEMLRRLAAEAAARDDENAKAGNGADPDLETVEQTLRRLFGLGNGPEPATAPPPDADTAMPGDSEESA